MTTNIIITGFGGQGVLFAGKILAYTALMTGKQLSWLPSYGPEMRGGAANCHVIVSDEPVGSPIITAPDVLISMNRPSLDKFENDVKPGGYIIVDSSLIDRETTRDDVNFVKIPATEMCLKEKLGNLANMVIAGKLIKETGLYTFDEIIEGLKKSVPPTKAALLEKNMKAIELGFNY